MNNWILISYYTPNYELIYNKYLMPSLAWLDIKCCIKPIKDLGNWKLNTDFKPEFVLECLNNANYDIVITDVDSSINEYPVLFDTLPKKYDIAVHTLNWETHYGRPSDKGKSELLSGTLYLRNNEKVRNLVKLWKTKCKDFSWEQNALQDALKEMPEIVVYDLPRKYCYISSAPERINGGKVAVPLLHPIITHYQASRDI